MTAPDAAYTASPYTGASATATGFGGLDQSITPLTYSGRNGTSYGPSTTAPTTVGDYTASATFAGARTTAAPSSHPPGPPRSPPPFPSAPPAAPLSVAATARRPPPPPPFGATLAFAAGPAGVPRRPSSAWATAR